MTSVAYAKGHEKGPGVGDTCLKGGDVDPSWSVREKSFREKKEPQAGGMVTNLCMKKGGYRDCGQIGVDSLET